jgi:cytochrome bd-type quinol oxidase subunit 2
MANNKSKYYVNNNNKQETKKYSVPLMECILRVVTIRTVLMIIFLVHSIIVIGCSWLLLYTAGQEELRSAEKVSIIK